MKSQTLVVRPAEMRDVNEIHLLLDYYARQEIVLSRSREDIISYLGNFIVAEDGGVFLGCCAARDFGNNLLEIRSLAVQPDRVSSGVGRAMVEAIEERLNRAGENWRLFALTLAPNFFGKLGFQVVSKNLFPEKIWSDCARCPKKNCCDEIAMLKQKIFER